MARKKPDGNGTTAALREERAELTADGMGKPLADAGDVIAAANAATNEPITPATPPAPQDHKEEHVDEPTTPPTPAAPEPQPKQGPAPRDPITEMLRQATGAVSFARSQMTPPKTGSGKSRADRFEIKADLAKATDEVQGWTEIVPSLVEAKGEVDAAQFDASIRAFERAFNRLQGVLDELSVRRCDANVHSIERAIGILEGPKWKGSIMDLTDAKKVLGDLKRVVRSRKPWPRVNERGDDAARSLWRLIEGRCYTCGSQLPRDFHGDFCDTCHAAFQAEKRQEQQKVAAADSDLLARLRQQMKKN